MVSRCGVLWGGVAYLRKSLKNNFMEFFDLKILKKSGFTSLYFYLMNVENNDNNPNLHNFGVFLW